MYGLLRLLARALRWRHALRASARWLLYALRSAIGATGKSRHFRAAGLHALLLTAGLVLRGLLHGRLSGR